MTDGEASAFFEDLGSVWTEAVLTADLPARERRAWAEKLAGWQRAVDDYGVDEAFAAAMAAAKQGWDYAPLVRVLQGERPNTGTGADETPSAAALTVARLNVLERQGRSQEYLCLAAAEGQTERYTTMLVRLGRVPEAVEYGLHHLATAEQALALARATGTLSDETKSARALRARDALHAALQIAEHGLRLAGARVPLAAWTADLALSLGETARALEAALIAFHGAPELAAYQKVQELAGERWPALRTELLTHVRQGRSHAAQGVVEIFLHEGLVEDAMRAVEGGASYALLAQVVDAAIPSHADWAIQICRQQAEPIMQQGQSQHYHHAARWL